jgi:hypothetical protein
MNRWGFAAVAILLASQFTSTGVGGGTVLFVRVLKDRIIMASDSRTVYTNKPLDDNRPKIATFGDHFIFGVSGAANTYNDGTFSWDAIEEAKKAAAAIDVSGSLDAQGAVDAFADAWETKMRPLWQSLRQRHPEAIEQIVQRNGGPFLSTGLFGAAIKGKVAFTARVIFSKQGRLGATTAIDVPTDLTPYAHREIFDEFKNKTSERAKKEKWEFPACLRNKNSLDLLVAAKYVDLSIKYDPTGDVGGHPEAAELFAKGGVHWYQPEKDCPVRKSPS